MLLPRFLFSQSVPLEEESCLKCVQQMELDDDGDEVQNSTGYFGVGSGSSAYCFHNSYIKDIQEKGGPFFKWLVGAKELCSRIFSSPTEDEDAMMTMTKDNPIPMVNNVDEDCFACLKYGHVFSLTSDGRQTCAPENTFLGNDAVYDFVVQLIPGNNDDIFCRSVLSFLDHFLNHNAATPATISTVSDLELFGIVFSSLLLLCLILGTFFYLLQLGKRKLYGGQIFPPKQRQRVNNPSGRITMEVDDEDVENIDML